ncbi:MAG: ComF family protein [Candidatus Omnitrophota bacterium]
MKEQVLSFGRAFLNLIYPLSCCTCGEKMIENKGLCDECFSKIEKNERGTAACRYEGILKEAIHQFKYKRVLSLVDRFSPLMCKFVDDNIDMSRIDTIVPVPLNRSRLRERGFNQSRLLSLALSKKYGVPVSSCLVKRKATKPQSGLRRAERQNNLKKAFSVKHPKTIKEKNILIIDDVYTTGATVNEASKTLKRAGAKSVMIAALARGI